MLSIDRQKRLALRGVVLSFRVLRIEREILAQHPGLESASCKKVDLGDVFVQDIADHATKAFQMHRRIEVSHRQGEIAKDIDG